MRRGAGRVMARISQEDHALLAELRANGLYAEADNLEAALQSGTSEGTTGNTLHMKHRAIFAKVGSALVEAAYELESVASEVKSKAMTGDASGYRRPLQTAFAIEGLSSQIGLLDKKLLAVSRGSRG